MGSKTKKKKSQAFALCTCPKSKVDKLPERKKKALFFHVANNMFEKFACHLPPQHSKN